ncbi:MAG: hypothetical protein WA510_02315, partial [Acidobacteriaceae bacterium]
MVGHSVLHAQIVVHLLARKQDQPVANIDAGQSPQNVYCDISEFFERGSSRISKNKPFTLYGFYWWALQDSNLRLPPCEG